MATLTIICGVLAVYHFVVDGIIFNGHEDTRQAVNQEKR